jgi:hypothetical protein
MRITDAFIRIRTVCVLHVCMHVYVYMYIYIYICI